MRVLHVNAGNETGGGKSHIIGLLSQFTNAEAELLVFEEGPVAVAARNHQIKVTVLSGKKILKYFKKYIQDNNFDIVHTHGPRANLFMRLIYSKVSVKWVTTIHSNPEFDFMNGGIKGKIFTKLNIWSYTKVDRFLLITKDFEQPMLKLGVVSEKIIPIFNAIDFSEPIVTTNLSRRQLNIGNIFTMIIIARLEPVKNHLLLLNALTSLPANLMFHLLIVGDGKMENELKVFVEEHQLSDKVTFLGFREDASGLYQLADISLLTSVSEGFPTVLLESAKCDVPVIATNVGSVEQIIANQNLGWVVSSGAVSELSNAIVQANKCWEKKHLQDRGQAFHLFAETHFSMIKLADLHREIYDKLLIE